MATAIGTAAALIGTLAAVAFAAISGVGGWSELVVLGGIALATVGTMIAVEPLMRDH